MMSNMNPNEIKKALECCVSPVYDCDSCPLYGGPLQKDCVCGNHLMKNALAYINQLEAEVERFKKRQKPTETSGYKIENGKVVFFTNILNGYRYEYKDLEEVVKTLNELLKEAYSKDEIAFALKCKTEDLKTVKSEAIKEFAERLCNDRVSNDPVIIAVKTELKEMVGDEE